MININAIQITNNRNYQCISTSFIRTIIYTNKLMMNFKYIFRIIYDQSLLFLFIISYYPNSQEQSMKKAIEFLLLERFYLSTNVQSRDSTAIHILFNSK